MRKLTGTLAFSLMAALPFIQAAHAQQASTPARIDESQYSFIQSAVAEPDPEAQEVSRKLLSTVITEIKDYPIQPKLYAQFLSFPGYPEKSFLMATLQGEATCGAMGCSTWVYLLGNGGQVTTVFEDTVNGIGFPRAPEAGQPVQMVVQKRLDEPLRRWTLTREGFKPGP